MNKATLTRRQLLIGAALGAIGTHVVNRYLAVHAIAAPKRIYLAPDDHTDFFWTADEATYRDLFLETLDYYLDLTDATAGLPADFQSRWNCDGSFWLWTYERNRTPAQFARLIARIKDGHISAPLNALVVCLGGAPAEAVLRGMYYAGQLERRHNLRFPVAVAMENQTLPFGLGALWAGAGARYSWKGICGCATRIDATRRDHEIYWLTGPDGSRVLMKWHSLLGVPGADFPNQGIGGYAEARYPEAVVEFVTNDPAFTARFPYDVIGAFGVGWDDLKTLTDRFPAIAQAKSNTERRVIVSNQLDFFADFEASYGTGLPTEAVAYGNEWDLDCAALAEVQAKVRRAVEKLRAAEAMATLVALERPTFMDDRRQARDQAWMNLGLFWEHNFGMVTPQTGEQGVEKRIAWQRRLAAELASYVDALHTDAAAALGGLIAKTGARLRFFAFNPLSWARSDYADLPYDGPAPVHVVDLTTGQETPSQIIADGQQRTLRILATAVPPVGYKVYEVRQGPGIAYTPAALVSGGTIESEQYRLELAARGAITSLVDRLCCNKELARTIGGRALNDLGPGGGNLRAEHVGPVSATLVALADGPLRHTTRVTLFRQSRRIEIENRITENFDATTTWSFGFNLDAPEIWHEEVGAVIKARLTSDGGHYAPRNARYDWLTLNHFAAVSAGETTVTLSSADCSFFGLGASTPTILDTTTPQLNVLAGGRVGGDGNLGIRNQGGDTQFLQRFALRSGAAFDQVESMRFALEHQNPLVAAPISGGPAYPGTNYSFLSISDPRVLLWALKPADDGIAAGIVVRAWNMARETVSPQISLPQRGIRAATQITHIETPISPAQLSGSSLKAQFAQQQLRSLLIVPDNPVQCLGQGAGQPGDARCVEPTPAPAHKICLPLIAEDGPPKPGGRESRAGLQSR